MKAIENRNYEKIMQKPNCLFGWYLDGQGNCVRIYYELKTWNEAKYACETVNAHLAHINDDSYDNMVGFIRKYFYGAIFPCFFHKNSSFKIIIKQKRKRATVS